MATHWSKKKEKKRKKCDVAIGNTLDNTLMGTRWELNGNTLEQEKRKKCDVAIGNILDNTLMRTLWELNGQKKKKKKLGPPECMLSLLIRCMNFF
jgi:hypothetical protein